MITEIVRAMVMSKRQPKSVEQVAGECGYAHPHTLYGELNPENSNHKLGADMLVPLMRACNEISPLYRMAQLVDAAVVDLSHVREMVQGRDMESVLFQALTAAKEFGEAAEACSAAAVDGVFSSTEAKNISHEIWETVEALILLDECVQRAAMGGGERRIKERG